MKKISFIILSFITILTGCNEDKFLKESPKDQVYADNLFDTYTGFQLAKNALLEFPRQERQDKIQSAELGFVWKVGTDVAWANTELSWSQALNRYDPLLMNSEMQILNGDQFGNPGLFLILYRAINSANTIINRAENSNVNWEGSSEEENLARKNEIIAHAKLIRAWAYRHLALTFGDVPLSLDEISGSNYKDDWERAPVSVIQEYMETDLLFAEQYLPDNAQDVSSLSKVIAQHYLTELYLWQNRNEEAVAKAMSVIKNTNFALIKNRFGVKKNEPGCAFMDQFYDGNVLPSQGNTETLWAFPNSEVTSLKGQYANTMKSTWGTDYAKLGIPYCFEYGGRAIARVSITAWVFTLYEPNDDRGSEYAIRRSYKKSDGSIIYTQTNPENMTPNSHQWASTRKWEWSFVEEVKWGERNSYADQAYLRLADTYLLLAEALHKCGNNSTTDGAAFYINEVRKRANASEITAGDVTLDFILDERARELVTEELRRETLVRTNKLVERTRKYNHIASGERDGGLGIQDFHVLLPIPQKVIDANASAKMEQNEGYN
ncbi:RagB/SusD family nutrient uptake outer membrane protein [Bacteroides intestinalis]|jgi:hypothetical protein|uniref:RagB/SusD family nutrient uptake outer membrane protein n=1 Tax=Bacteroides intestinalis TaxID=329854 RepID=UPI000E48ACB1|nr:RagB/SusD family nutrient uptake outer membrane protein [Bacteroides intestinalis]RGX87306.1 RagB/SusD family nutrient uptake outer membrane protein [Bacteroides intestinalis]